MKVITDIFILVAIIFAFIVYMVIIEHRICALQTELALMHDHIDAVAEYARENRTELYENTAANQRLWVNHLFKEALEP